MPPRQNKEVELPADFDLQSHLRSKRIVPSRGTPAAPLWIIGEAAGAHEDQQLRPFCGPSGNELEKLCRSVGFTTNDCFVDNVIPYRPKDNKLQNLEVPIRVFYPALAEKVRQFRPNCILAVGRTALKALCDVEGITVRRGSILESTLVPGQKVVPTIHVAEILRDWGLRFYIGFDIERAWRESKTPIIDLPVRTYIIKPSMQNVVEAFHEIEQAPEYCVDIETRGGRIACVGLGCSQNQAICIPLEYASKASYWSFEEECEVFRLLANLFALPQKKVIIQNHPFDFSFLWQYHLPIMGEIWDPMTMHNLLWPDLRHGLDVLCSLYTREPYYKEEGKLWEAWMGEEQFWTYNGKDVCVEMEVYHRLYAELKQRGLLAFYEEHYRRPQAALLSTQLRGFRIHENRRKRMRKSWEIKVSKAMKVLQEALGAKIDLETLEASLGPLPEDRVEDIVARAQRFNKEIDNVNVNSPAQMKWLLYEHLHLPEQRDRRTGELTTREDALEKLYVKSQHPILRQILEARGLRKFLSSYLNVELDADGRLRSSFGHTDFGRLKASKFLDATGTNIQTIPEVGRAFFISD